MFFMFGLGYIPLLLIFSCFAACIGTLLLSNDMGCALSLFLFFFCRYYAAIPFVVSIVCILSRFSRSVWVFGCLRVCTCVYVCVCLYGWLGFHFCGG